MFIITFSPLIGPNFFFFFSWRKKFDSLLKLNSSGMYVEFKIFQKYHSFTVKPSFYSVPRIFISLF